MSKLLFLALTFTFCLFTSAFCEPEVAITVNGDNIYRDVYDYALARYEEPYRKHFGDSIDAALREKIKKELIDELVNSRIYLQEAKRRGITAKAFANEEEIEELLMLDPLSSLEGKSARDSAERVILAYKMNQIIPPKVIAAIKEDISMSDENILDEYLKRAEKMSVRYIEIDAVAIANNMEISEDDLMSYYRDHGDQFRRPAAKEYAVLYFDPEDYADEVKVTAQRREEYYNKHMDEFSTGKLARVKYVLFRTKDYLNQVIDPGVNPRQYYEEHLDEFTEPAEAKVRMISLGASPEAEVSDLGIIKKGALKEPFNSIVFGLEVGESSGAIKTNNGYKKFYVELKKEERVPSFDEVKEKIEERLLDDAARLLALADAKRFKIEARKMGFDRAAANKGLAVFETDYFGASDTIPTIGRNLSFTSSALSLGTGEVGNEVDYDNGYAVFEVSDIKPQEYLPFSRVSGDIDRKIVDEDSSARAEADANSALKLISEKVPLKDLEKRNKGRVSITEASPTLESPAVGTVTKKDGGYYITLPAAEKPSYIPDLGQISNEVASAAALDRAGRIAGEKAYQILKTGAITKEGAFETAVFSMNDYMIGQEYMRPFIEQCHVLKDGQASIVKSQGKYYVAQVVERGIQLPGYKDDSAVVKSQVLKEKRAEYADKWLKKERAKAQIRINL
jgi:peptidyl-prolyl cis-trans isomerase D